MEYLDTVLEAIAVLTGLAYLIEAARLKRYCWVYGGISSLLYIYIFFNANLYVDGSLNVYYLLMAFVGWFGWGKNQAVLPVTTLKIGELLLCILVPLVLAAFLGWGLERFTPAEYPLTDSFIGALAVTATWLTVRKKIETWPFWVVADGVAAVLFFYKELYLTAGLMVIYCVLAIVAWINWHKERTHATATA